jgi:hypothetical protein
MVVGIIVGLVIVVLVVAAIWLTNGADRKKS